MHGVGLKYIKMKMRMPLNNEKKAKDLFYLKIVYIYNHLQCIFENEQLIH